MIPLCELIHFVVNVLPTTGEEKKYQSQKTRFNCIKAACFEVLEPPKLRKHFIGLARNPSRNYEDESTCSRTCLVARDGQAIEEVARRCSLCSLYDILVNLKRRI